MVKPKTLCMLNTGSTSEVHSLALLTAFDRKDLRFPGDTIKFHLVSLAGSVPFEMEKMD